MQNRDQNYCLFGFFLFSLFLLFTFFLSWILARCQFATEPKWILKQKGYDFICPRQIINHYLMTTINAGFGNRQQRFHILKRFTWRNQNKSHHETRAALLNQQISKNNWNQDSMTPRSPQWDMLNQIDHQKEHSRLMKLPASWSRCYFLGDALSNQPESLTYTTNVR